MKAMKLLIRGGSIAAGYGVSRSYVDILRDHYASWNVSVINRSNPQETSFEGIWTFQEEIDPYRPDILLLHFGIDDAFLSVYRSEFKENLVNIVRLATARFQPAILLLTSHTFDNPHDMNSVSIYYRTIREVSVELHCEMVPIHTYWAGYLDDHHLENVTLVQEDVRYPNERGHEIFAHAVMARLDRIIPLIAGTSGTSPLRH